MIHLDTSFLIRALLDVTPEMRLLRSWLEEREPVGISAVCWTEFLCGPLRERHIDLAREILGEPAPYAGETARLAARLFSTSGRRRGSLVDCMVAASAIAADAALATSNRKDFQRFVPHGLKLA